MQSIKLFPSKSTTSFRKLNQSPKRSAFDSGASDNYQSQKKINRYESWADITTRFSKSNFQSKNDSEDVIECPEYLQTQTSKRVTFSKPLSVKFTKKQPQIAKAKNDRGISKRVQAIIQQRKVLVKQIMVINQKLREERIPAF